MIETVKNFLIENNIRNKKVIIGFSSGPDSVALTLILNKLKLEFNLDIILAYFNHGWRKEALEEENFACEFASEINALCYIKKAPKNTPKKEEEARNLRYDFFKECAKKYNTDVVFLAHNKNDNIETLIYRIIKGTSLKGLTSIPKIRDIYYRPLLEIEKKDILNFLNLNKQTYKIDSSNNDIKYNRNYIRKEILPKFEKINPNYINSINTLIKTSIENQKIIDDKIKEIKAKIIKDEKILRDDFIKLDLGYRYEILNDYLADRLKYRDYKNIKKFDDFILNNFESKCSINSDDFLKIKNNEIYIEKKSQKNKGSVEIKGEGEYNFGNIILSIKKTDSKKVKNFKTPLNKCYLELSFPLVLRHRNSGDIFSPCGLKKGKMKLKDYLINEKIEQNKKDELMLLCKENEVIWILGMKISEKYKVKNNEFYELKARKK